MSMEKLIINNWWFYPYQIPSHLFLTRPRARRKPKPKPKPEPNLKQPRHKNDKLSFQKNSQRTTIKAILSFQQVSNQT